MPHRRSSSSLIRRSLRRLILEEVRRRSRFDRDLYEKIVIRRYVYGVKRVWRISCVEKDVAWSSSVAKYLQGKMAQGETITFEVNGGERYQLQSVQAYIASLELEIPQTGTQSIRRYTVTLKEK